MQEKLSKEVQEREALKARKVVLVMGADMVTLSGHWNWELYSDVIYASDVMQAFPSEYIGTKGIIHPDDLPHLRELIFSLQIPKQASVDFRIITSFGQVVPVSGRGIEVESNEVLDTGSALLNKDLRLLELEKENEKLHLEIRLAAYAERVLDTAHWLMNTTDHFIYYSDQFYRIHGIPPQSLNAHLHTFLHFVHPDDL